MNTNIDTRYTPIPGYSKYGISNSGEVVNLTTNRMLSVQRYPNGYYYYHLISDKGANKSCLRHRLLMMTFNPIDGMSDFIVNHLDGVKGNDVLSNLEWSTYKANVEHAGRVGLTSKCIPVEVLNINTGDITVYPSATDCGRKLGLTKDAVLFRLSKSEDHVFPEGNQYRKYTGDKFWAVAEDASHHSRYSNGTNKSVTLRHIKSGDMLEFVSITAAARYLDKSLAYMSTLLSGGKRHPVIPGGYQVKYTHDTSLWRPCNYLEEIKGVVVLIEIEDIDGNVSIHEGISATAHKLGINPTTLQYRLTSNGTRRFNDGNKYRYHNTFQ